MSNGRGFKILDGTPPTGEKVLAAKAEISAENLRKFQQSISSLLGFEKLGWGENCNKLLHDGLDLAGDEYLKQLLHGPYESAEIHLTAVVVWISNLEQLPRLKAARGRVLIYKAMEEGLGPQDGFFRIVEGSHRMSPEQISKSPARDIHLKPGQAIILDGDLVIEYPKEGGGVGLMKCVLKSKA